ncbi:MAG: hypothetical protein AB1631_27080 [Acidobacteriota bacterium]
MKLLSLKEAQASADPDIKMLVVRSSRYRVFGSSERIPDAEIFIIDLRDGKQDADLEERFRALDRHPFFPILLARKLS